MLTFVKIKNNPSTVCLAKNLKTLLILRFCTELFREILINKTS